MGFWTYTIFNNDTNRVITERFRSSGFKSEDKQNRVRYLIGINWTGEESRRYRHHRAWPNLHLCPAYFKYIDYFLMKLWSITWHESGYANYILSQKVPRPHRIRLCGPNLSSAKTASTTGCAWDNFPRIHIDLHRGLYAFCMHKWVHAAITGIRCR